MPELALKMRHVHLVGVEERVDAGADLIAVQV